MRRLFFLILTLFVFSSPIFGQAPSIYIDHVDGLTNLDTLQTNVPITFHIRLTNDYATPIIGSTNGFKVYSNDGATWNETVPLFTDGITSNMYDGGRFVNQFSVDGQFADTVGFGGLSFFGSGIPSGFSEIAWQIKIGPIDPVNAGKVICVDSTFYPPASVWKWSTSEGEKDPSWGGPYCYFVEVGDIIVNQPPVLNPIGSQVAMVGTPIYLNVSAFDPDGTIPNLSAYPIPEGAHFVDSGGGFGQFSWLPSINQVGSNYVTFFAVDEHGATDSEFVEILVIAANSGIGGVSLMSVSDIISDYMIPTDKEVELIYKVTNSSNSIIQGMTHGFIISSPDGANWGATNARTTDNTNLFFDLYNNVTLIDINGQNTDTLLFGLVGSMSGIPNGFDDSTFSITLGPIDDSQIGKTICIDTTFVPPTGYWAWSDATGTLLYPGWEGRRCFTIAPSDTTRSFISWLSPNNANQGDSIWINFYGFGTRFTMGNPIFRLIMEDLVIDPIAINIIEDTVASCLFIFNDLMPVGKYTAIYGNTFESSSLHDYFTLDKGDDTPEITWVYPDHGTRGDTMRVQINVQNYNLLLDPDSLRVHFQQGFSVFTPLEQVVYDDTSMGVLIAIPPLATPGYYDISISGGMPPGVFKSQAFFVEGESDGSGSVVLDFVEGYNPATGRILLNMPVEFHLRLRNFTGQDILGFTNGFKIYSPDGATWGGTYGDTTGAITPVMMESVHINPFDANGAGADTVGFGGFTFFSNGIPNGFDDVPFIIHLDGFGPGDEGKTVCIDSTFYRPAGNWKWALTSSNIFPEWSGEECFIIGDTLYNSCDVALSTDHLEFSASPNQGNPPCQVFRTGTNCPTYATTNSTWITIYSYMDTTFMHMIGHGVDTVLEPAYKVCTDISMLTPGHRYHDTILVYSDSLNMPETVFVDLRIGDEGIVCNQPFVASVIAWENFGYPDSGAIFGILDEATDGYDLRFDQFHFGGTRVYFPHEEYGLLYDNLAVDFRSPIDNGCKRWRFEVIAEHTGTLNVAMSMMNLPILDSYNFKLFNERGHLIINDFETQSYTFNTVIGEAYSFQIEVCCNLSSCEQTFFTNVVETGKSYTYIIPNASYCYGMSQGDEIGLFDKQTGVLVGSAVYCNEQFPLSIPAWQADLNHGLPGFVEGNDLEVRIYNKALGKIMCADVFGQCLPFNDCSYGVIDSLACYECGDQFCADFPLATGRWQLVSVPVWPMITYNDVVSRCDVDAFFGNLSGLEILKDDQGNAYIPEYGVNDIDCISHCEGYNIFLTGNPDTLCFSGYPIGGASCMVHAGRWNMISYPLTCPRPVEWVLSSIINCIDIVMDDQGRVYIPGQKGINTIGEMIPGKGYYLFLSCEADLMIEYPNCFIDSMPTFGKDDIAYQSAASGNVSHYQYTNTGLPFAIVLRDINEAVSPGDEIAVFDGSVCVGAVQYNGEKTIVIPAWKGDAEHNLPGYTAGNSAEIRVYRTDGTEDILIEETTGVQFGNSNYQAISVGGSKGLPQAYHLDQNYPNPFNPATTISFSLPAAAHVRIEIFNTLGRKVNTVTDADYDAGSFDVKWNGTDYNGQSVSTGVYLYRIEANDFIETKKMLLMK